MYKKEKKTFRFQFFLLYIEYVYTNVVMPVFRYQKCFFDICLYVVNGENLSEKYYPKVEENGDRDIWKRFCFAIISVVIV